MTIPIQINACAYCGRKAQGHYTIHRDGLLNGCTVQVPLCDDCGAYPRPSTREIWARISLVDDAGNEYGPTQGPCAESESRELA